MPGDSTLSSPVRLVVGLGNPGTRYAMTRHNAGFRFVDGWASHLGKTFRATVRFLGQTCHVEEEKPDYRLFKPATFMNRSGLAVAALFRYYRYRPEQLLVIHDEIDLPPGVIRFKQGGGHGGHNGLRDIVAHLDTRDFNRLRIGVGHPGYRDEVVRYVLQTAPVEEQTLTDQAIERAYAQFPALIRGDIGRVMNTLHAAT